MIKHYFCSTLSTKSLIKKSGNFFPLSHSLASIANMTNIKKQIVHKFNGAFKSLLYPEILIKVKKVQWYENRTRKAEWPEMCPR